MSYGTAVESLVSSFTIKGDAVLVDDVVQESGITPNNFKKPVLYKIRSADGEYHTYEVYIEFYSGLPIIDIRTDDGNSVNSKSEYTTGSIEIKDISKNEILSKSIKIRGRGNSTWQMPKKPYQIKFDKKESVLGMDKDKRWILLANFSDKTMLRNEAALMMGKISSLDWTPDSRFVELVLNGEYQGVYQLTQKIEATSNRVDIGKKGYLLEVDQMDRLGEDDVYFTTDRNLFNIKEPELSKDDASYKLIREFITDVESSLYSDDFQDPDTGYRRLIDVESFVDWYLINELTKNTDAAFHTSVFMNYVPGGKLKMGPIWDFDISLGNVDYNDNKYPTGFWVKNRNWIKRMFEDPYFVEVVKSRFQHFSKHRRDVLHTILAGAEKLDDAQKQNFKKWPILGTKVWPNYMVFDTYKEEVDYLHQWLNTRWDWMEQAISDL